MRSQRAEDDTTKVSLFPFLAVLLCTMGALIVLLIVIARQARVAAAQPDPSEEVVQNDPDERKRQTLLQKSKDLEDMRLQVSEDLDNKQKHLGFIEDRSRKLEDELIKLQAQYEKAVRLSQADAQEIEQAGAELRRLQAAVAEAQKALDTLAKDADSQRPTYSIIPYQGSRKTKRRPIYIECRSDSVILHPEGIVLTEEDFLIPSDTGNPLAAALRATREYIAEQAYSSGEEDPYPLILIRPGGTESYDAVRRAMKGWGPEFGYELIDDDWEMNYPAADPNLAQTQYRAVQEARARLKMRIAQMRSRMQGRSYVPAPGRGGLIEEGTGGGLLGGRPRFGMMKTGGSLAGNRGPESRPLADPSRRQGSGPAADGPRQGSNQHLANRGRHENQSPNNGNPSDGNRGVSNKPGGRPGGQSQTAGDGGPSVEQQASHGNAQTGGPENGPGGGESGGPASPLSAGSPTARQSLARERGKNWGLKQVVRSSIGITRPVRISCYHDRLVIRSDETSRRGKVITLGPDARENIDQFVEATWQQTKSWGIAGKGMYWKPILSFQVEPGGENRFQELSALLKDSGLEIRRAKPRSQAFRSRPYNTLRRGASRPR